MKPEAKRRYCEREFNSVDLRKLFGLEVNEWFMDAYFDKDRNKLIVKTRLDFDKTQGDK